LTMEHAMEGIGLAGVGAIDGCQSAPPRHPSNFGNVELSPLPPAGRRS
jgi:hypothetical protein